MQRDSHLKPVESPGFRLVKADSIEPTAPRWLVREYLEADSLALVFGDPGCAKSFLAVDLACSIATGEAFHGHAVNHGPVIFLAGEGLNGLARRRKAWCIRHQADLEDAPLYVSTGPAALCSVESALQVQQAVDGIAEAEGSPALVVVDTLARNFGPGDENSTQDMGQVINTLDRMRSEHRSTVLLVHHTGHADKTRARGAMALKGALDAEYRMERDETGIIRFTPTKMKDAPEPQPLAFRLATVELGLQDADGQEVTSAVLNPSEYTAPPRRGSAGRGRNQTAALSALKDLLARQAEYLEATGRSPDAAQVTVAEWQEACKVAGMDRRRFREAMHSLRDKNLVQGDDSHIWIPRLEDAA